MKYGESIFDIVYLLFTVVTGIYMVKRTDESCRYMGIATLVLGCGDAFHLIPRVLDYFSDADFTSALGIGKLITSITMTVFYVIMYRIWIMVYGESDNRTLGVIIYLLSAVRVILCMMPQNNWMKNDSPMAWGIIRNIPFLIIGTIIIWLYYKKRVYNQHLSFIWVYVLLSFLFYMPVATIVLYIPMLGILMLPKTVCYMLIVLSFFRYTTSNDVSLDRR